MVQALPALCFLGSGASAWAQSSYPSRGLRVIVPQPPGGGFDFVARVLAERLGKVLSQTVVVENKPGSGTLVGTDAAAKADPDGYTLLMGSVSNIALNMGLYDKLPYDSLRDFEPVGLAVSYSYTLMARKDLPFNSLKELVAYAKANPGKLTFAVGSVGSAGHLATELLKHNGLDYTVVPYKGTAPAFQDLIGGQISGFIDPILGSLQYHKNGLLRVVAVTSAHRTPNLPDVPTVSETLPGYEFYSWYGLWAPVKASQEIKDVLNAQVNKALATDMKDKLISQGLIVGGGSIEDFRKFQADDMAKSQKLITEGNIRLE